MLHLLLGPSGSGKSYQMLAQLRARAERGQPSLLIVPEQFTSSTEGLLYRTLGDTLSAYVESYSFTTLAEALLRPARTLPLAQAVGHTAAEYVWAYPPGVPLLAPGETVTPGLAAAVAALADAGTALRHSGGSAPDALRVLA